MGSTFSDVSVISTSGVKKQPPEIFGARNRVEAGVLVEVPPGSSRTVSFSWSHQTHLDGNNPGSANFYWRKQAGIDADVTTISFAKSSRALYGNPPFALTKENNIGYNVNLERDIEAQLNW